MWKRVVGHIRKRTEQHSQRNAKMDPEPVALPQLRQPGRRILRRKRTESQRPMRGLRSLYDPRHSVFHARRVGGLCPGGTALRKEPVGSDTKQIPASDGRAAFFVRPVQVHAIPILQKRGTTDRRYNRKTCSGPCARHTESRQENPFQRREEDSGRLCFCLLQRRGGQKNADRIQCRTQTRVRH